MPCLGKGSVSQTDFKNHYGLLFESGYGYCVTVSLYTLDSSSEGAKILKVATLPFFAVEIPVCPYLSNGTLVRVHGFPD